MKKIVYIAPENITAGIARKAALKNNIDVEILIAKGEKRFEAAMDAEKKGAEVAVSRWGFSFNQAQLRLNITVVNVEINGFDISRTLYNIRHIKNNIGIIHKKKVIEGFLKLAPLFGVTIKHYAVIDSIDPNVISFHIEKLKNKGIEFILGSLDVIERAKAHGLSGYRIEIGLEGIESALNEANRLIPIKFKEREKTNQIKTILDFAYDGIIAVDNNRYVTVFNRMAREITEIEEKEILGRKIDEFIEENRLFDIFSEDKPVLHKLQRVNDRYIVSNHIPVYVKNKKTGTVVNFVDTSRILAIETKLRKEFSKKGLEAKYRFDDILGNSPKIKNAINIAKKYSQSDASILIQGETGTGKEIFAQSIHNESLRKDGPFVAINCAALPENILESELFGYAGGAFTGAKKEGKPGLFELAHNGTIFLDEVSEMTPRIQARFLRVLQEKKVIRLGGDTLIPVNVRVISATNVNLVEMINKGKFRKDLYYRISTLNLELPPLRERTGDLLLLARCFFEEYQKKYGKKTKPLDERVIESFMEYNWPGNVRELKNIVEQIVVLSDQNGNICNDYLQLILKNINIDLDGKRAEDTKLLKRVEKETILKALNRFNGNRKKTAEYLGISTTTLWRKLRSH